MLLSFGRPAVRTRREGLTLLEVMLALAITALVVSAVYGSLRTAGESLQAVSARNELYRTAHAVLDELARELGSSYVTWNGNRQDARAATYFYAEKKEVNGMRRDDLFFTTYGHARTENARGESDQAEVCYAARYSDTRRELVLLKREIWGVREETCMTARWNWDSRDEPLPHIVATGIHPEKGPGYLLVGFQVEPFQNPTDKDPQEDWNSMERNALPSRVRVTLTYRDSRKTDLPFSREVLLRLGGPVQPTVPVQTQTGAQTQRPQKGSVPAPVDSQSQTQPPF